MKYKEFPHSQNIRMKFTRAGYKFGTMSDLNGFELWKFFSLSSDQNVAVVSFLGAIYVLELIFNRCGSCCIDSSYWGS